MKIFSCVSAALLIAACLPVARAQVTTTVTPTSLTFQVALNGPTPAAQQLQITSVPPNQGFSAQAFTTSGGTWLTISQQNVTGAVGQTVTGVTPATLQVSVNPAGLSAGTYQGSVNFTIAGSSPVNVPVTLIVGGTTITATPSTTSFSYQVGGALPGPQSVQLASSGGPFGFTIQTSTTSGGGWLSASANTSNYPATLTITVNPINLPAGSYDGKVTVTTPNVPNSTLDIPVHLTVSTTPVVTPSLSSVNFNFQTGGANPATQILTLSNLGQGLPYTATFTPTSGGNFLTITPTNGSTPGALLLTANPGSLTAGNYQGTISIAVPGAGNTPIQIPVNFNVSSTQLLNADPGSLTFNSQSGQAAPPAQTVNLTSTGSALNYTVSASTVSGTSWLSVTPLSGSTPGQLSVSVNPGGLAAGSYSGLITIDAPGSGSGPKVIPVTLNVSATAVFNITPSSLSFTAQAGSNTPPAAQSLNIGSSGVSFNYAVAIRTQNGGDWLSVTPATGTTGSSLQVTVNPANLGVGTYVGVITVTSAGIANSPQTIPVVLTVTAPLALTASPANLTFAQTVGGSNPATQTLAVSTNTGAATQFTAQAIGSSNGVQWLSVSPTSGTAPANVTVSATGTGLPVGTYTGYVLLAASGLQSLVVPVTFTVSTAPTVSLSATTLSFSSTVGSLNPPVQTVQLTASGSTTNFTASAATTTGGSWLFVSPNSGSVTPGTPTTLSISVAPANLQPGNYTGTITVSTPGAVTATQTITVNLTVSQVTPVNVTSTFNAASQLATPAAPGEIITIYGTNLGPATPVGAHVTNGVVDNQLGGVQVLFDGNPAPLIYVSATQINAIVPYEVGNRTNTVVQVMNNGVNSQTLNLQVVPFSPAIFTAGATGTGQGAILNQDFSVNGAGNPEARGRVIQIYATGEGATTPGGVNGRVATGNLLAHPNATVTARVGGVPATVQYAGSAPGLVSGALQVNVLIPANAPTGSAVPVDITVTGPTGNPVTSQAGVTVAIK